MNAPWHDLPTLHTSRLELRKLRLADAADVFAYASDPAVARYTTWPPHPTLAVTEDFLRDVLRRYQRGLVGPWGVIHQTDGKLIGTCGFTAVIPWHGRAELGYALSRTYWGHGYIPEATAAVLAFGFQTLGLNRIEARCEVGNVASERVMQKVGMQYEGVLRQHMEVRGQYRDLKLYAILRSDWPPTDHPGVQ